MNRKIILIIGIIAISTLILCGCTRAKDRHEYFGGAVIIEYEQNTAGDDDYLILRFYDTGEYTFNFEPNLKTKDFSITIKSVPREKIIKQYVLPDFLTISVWYKGQVESYEFS